MIHGVPRYRIARLKPDGSLDFAFDTGQGFRFKYASGGEDEYNGVSALAVQPDGQILVAGRFNDFNGLPRYAVARLNGDLPLNFTSLAVLPDRVFRFTVATRPHSTYVLEFSEDLREWTPASTNTAVADRLVFDDLDAPTTSHLFFRIVRRP